MARTIDVSAVVVMLVAGIYLYLASLPISGALTFVGGGKTSEEIKRAERHKKWQSRLGLTLLIIGSFVQVLRLVGVLGWELSSR